MSEADKERVGAAAAALVEPGMRVGLGTGSTARAFISALGRRVEEGLEIAPAIATSLQSAQLARALGLPLTDPLATTGPERVDLAVDGADEIDPAGRLIKGGGGSLLREKIVAQMAERFVVIADASKLVETLGAFPLPVEVQPFAIAATRARLAALGCAPQLRVAAGAPVVTDNNNWVFDCPFGAISEPEALSQAIFAIPAVAEHGLFLTEAHEAMIAGPDGIERRTFAR